MLYYSISLPVKKEENVNFRLLFSKCGLIYRPVTARMRNESRGFSPMSVKLAAVDLDGTLLNSKNEVTPAVAAAVREAIAAGIEVVVATGRAPAECRSVLEALPELRYLICYTGAVVYDRKEDRQLYECLLTAEEGRFFYRLLRDFDCLISLFTGGKVYNALDRMQNFEHFCSPNYRPLYEQTHTILPDLDGFVEKLEAPVEKLYIPFSTPEECAKAYAQVKDLPYFITTAGFVDFEIMNRRTNKGIALDALMEHLGLRREEVLAVGDSLNDRDLLDHAGLAAVMANGSEELKQQADLLLPSNDEDGVAWLLHRLAEGVF